MEQGPTKVPADANICKAEGGDPADPSFVIVYVSDISPLGCDGPDIASGLLGSNNPRLVGPSAEGDTPMLATRIRAQTETL